MKTLNLLAFDLGASNGRAILGRFDGDKLEMRELHRFENNYVEMNGVFYWDLPYLYNQLKQACWPSSTRTSAIWIAAASTHGAWTSACWTGTATAGQPALLSHERGRGHGPRV